MKFNKIYTKLLNEYTYPEGDQIYKLLKSDYKSRRVILSDTPPSN
jgi:hypothetical protein